MRLSPSDIKSLAVFRAVVEHNGFVGAQAALNLGQPAISFHIKALEERVGFRLCDRGRGGFALTEKGEMVYERSKSVVSALSEFENVLGELRHQISGTLKVGLVDNTVTNPELPIHEVVRRFLEKAPAARLELSVASAGAVVSELGNGTIDVAIVPEIRRSRSLRFSRFYDEVHSLYAASEHPIWRGRKIDREMVEKTFPFVVRPYTNRSELQHFPGATVGARASNMEAQAILIRSGQLLGYLPDHYATRWCGEGILRPVLQESTRIASPFFIATREAKRQPLLLRVFIRELMSGEWAQTYRPKADPGSP